MSEELVTCPFDNAHQISALKLQNHIVKCQRNNPGIKIKTCPFNATHILRIPDYKSHVNCCPDNVMVLRTLTKEEDLSLPSTSSFSPKIRTTSISPPTLENWEDEFVEESVLQAIQEKPPAKFKDVTKLSGLKPSEKKLYYNSLTASGSSLESEAKITSIGLSTPIYPQPNLKKLRLPVVNPEVAALQTLNRGRGVLAVASRSDERPGRIAANIFSQGNPKLKSMGAQLDKSRPND